MSVPLMCDGTIGGKAVPIMCNFCIVYVLWLKKTSRMCFFLSPRQFKAKILRYKLVYDNVC